jgi:radical SAM family uncharacterized protein
MSLEKLDRLLYRVSKPARYTGGEWHSQLKDWTRARLHFALAYPETYEIGMSSLTVPLLYHLLNTREDVLCERVFAPWVDLEALLRESRTPLFSLESKRALGDFDVIGFSLGYELTFTNMLNMLDLAGIPPLAAERGPGHPLVMAGGGSVVNPEPVADFIDLFVVGEAEYILPRLLPILIEFKGHKQELLEAAAGLPGIYVPSFYRAQYHPDGALRELEPINRHAARVIRRQIANPLPPPVLTPLVPFIETIHDHAAIEIQRGCSRGCRFCQASTLYRPVRERSHAEVTEAVGQLVHNTGYSEVSLISLSTGDYHDITGLVGGLVSKYGPQGVQFSLPSLRMDSHSVKLLEMLPSRRKMTLTFAPEAGTDRLRNAINKPLSDATIDEAVGAAAQKQGANLKLYFMIGLPTETLDDVRGIVNLAGHLCRLQRQVSGRPPRLKVSVSTFVPKPHTPCQWQGQEEESTLIQKREILHEGLRRTGASFSWHDPEVSRLEAVFSRGDRRQGKAIYTAWRAGCRFDGWREHFQYGRWMEAFAASGLDTAVYAHRPIRGDEVLPWDHIDVGVSKGFLIRENSRILTEETTPDCRTAPCHGCGLQRWEDGCKETAKTEGVV